MDFTMTPLPYSLDALEPHISREQLYYHYEKHHRGYLEKLDSTLTNSKQRTLTLEEIIRTSDGKVFDLAAQLWNHQFLWQSLSPRKVDPPKGMLGELLTSSFGGVDAFYTRFTEAAVAKFGSGWAWLVVDPASGQLDVTCTDDAANPIPTNAEPLLTLDLWEHAYYLDYKNDRGAYVSKFLDHLINWEFASANLNEVMRHQRQRASR